MSKKLIGIIVGAVLVVALALSLVFLNQVPPPPASSISTPEVLYVLHAAEGTTLESATITNEAGGYGIVASQPADATDPVYELEGYEGYPIGSALASFARGLVTLSARSLVSEGGNAATYGLDTPAATVDILYSDGSSATLKVGDAAPGTEGYYVSEGGSEAVYLVSSALVDDALSTALSFMDKTVTGGDREATTIDSAELGGSLRPEPIVIQSVEEGSREAEMFITHLITSPIQVGADGQFGMEALRGAFAISAEEVVGTAPDDESLAEYGLLEPYSTISVTTPEDAGLGTIRLKASQPDAEGFVYLMNDVTDLVYRVEAAELPWLEVQLFDVMNKLVILPYIDDISTITIHTPEEDHVFTLEGEGSEAVATLDDGPALDMDLFRSFYQEMLSARYDGLIEVTPHEDDSSSVSDDDSGTDTSPPAAIGQIPEDAPLLLSYTYAYRDGRPSDVVSFYAGPTRQAYIQLNDGQAYLTPIGYVENVLPNIAQLQAGEEIVNYLF